MNEKLEYISHHMTDSTSLSLLNLLVFDGVMCYLAREQIIHKKCILVPLCLYQ